MTSKSSGSFLFLLGLAGLCLLPLWPEAYLAVRTQSGLKPFLPIAYYACLLSCLLLAPALFLGRLWATLLSLPLCIATLVTGVHAVCFGARWNLTAHTALLQTNPGESTEFVLTFLGWQVAASLLLTCLGYTACLWLLWRSNRPRLRFSLSLVAAGLLFFAYGLNNEWRYSWPLFHEVEVPGGGTVRTVEVKLNRYHPVSLLAFTHLNYRGSHAYFLAQIAHSRDLDAELAGARPLKGAVPPRCMVVVVGESSNRLHWSLYGYGARTNPRLEALASELFVFTDVISSTTGSSKSIKDMLLVPSGIPVFGLFAKAGWKTHWVTTQFSQGVDDLEQGALTSVCDEHLFLDGQYDEKLVDHTRRILEEPGRHLIFLNLLGSHVRYEDRYPRSFAFFTGEGRKAHTVATYDNSIRYTDHVLASLLDLLAGRGEPSLLLYASDHGEDVYDSNPEEYRFRTDAAPTNPMYEVPLLVWLSPEYKRGNPGMEERLAQARRHKGQLKGLYHGLIELARLEHPCYDPRRSLFSPSFEETERLVGVPGRPYQP